jgi:hypothetical protein
LVAEPPSLAFRTEDLCWAWAVDPTSSQGSGVHEPSGACWYAWQGFEVEDVDRSLVFCAGESFASAGAAAKATIEPTKINLVIRI